MHEYELRVLMGGEICAIRSEIYLNATSATHAAFRFAKGQPFEVWCDGRCIYSGKGKPRGLPPVLVGGHIDGRAKA